MAPTLRAAFQPTVIDMSRFGASARSGCEGDIQVSSHSSVPGLRWAVLGESEEEWVPPAMMASSMPAMTVAAAVEMAASPEAQWRLWARPGTSVRPDSMAT